MRRSRTLLLVAALAALLAVAFALLRARPERVSAPETALAGAPAEDHRAELARPAVEAPSSEANASERAAGTTEAPQARARAAAALADDAVQCLVFGRVTDATGAPVRQWHPWVSLRGAGGAEASAEADDDGHYSLAGLAPGRWTLACSGIGLRDQREELELTLTEPIVRRDFKLEKAARVKVQVIAPDGRPYWKAVKESGGKYTMRDLLPVATDERPGASIPEADGLHNDHVGVGNLWDYGPPREGLGPTYLGVVMLDHDPPVYVSLLSGIHVLETQRVEAGQDEVTFVLDPETVANARATLSLRALDAVTRAPLAGLAEVRGTTGPGPSAALDPGGACRLSLDPGEYDLRVFAEGHECLPRHVRLAAGQELDLGELALEAELTIEGRVLDADGRPRAGQELLVLWNDPELGRLVEVVTAAADGDGRIDVRGLRADRYWLRSYGDDEHSYPGRNEPPTEWVCGFQEVSTQSGSVRDLELRLVKAAELVLSGTDTLAPGSYFRLLDERGAVLRAQYFHAGASRVKVPPGRYTLLVLGEAGTELSRRALELREGMTELDLAR